MANSSSVDEGEVTSSGISAGDNPLKHSLLLLIVQIVVILCFSRLISCLFRPLRQPRVVAEIIAGVLLGPVAFGRLPGFTNTIFPDSSLAVLETVANFGLIFFLFLVGLELDLRALRKTGSTAASVASAGIALPFLLSVPVSLAVFTTTGMKQRGERFALPFILFMGVAQSITAFPVLAKILAERNIISSEIGQLTIPAAALNDVVAWLLLALAVAVTNSGSSPLVVVWVLVSGIVYLLVMFMLVRPLMHTLAKKDPVPEAFIAIMLIFVLLSSFATDAIGIHVIFGAFVMGLIVPKDRPITAVLIEKTEDYVTILLLPLYFTSSGLKTDLDSVNNITTVGIVVLVTASSVVGKVVGTLLVIKLMMKRLSFRNSLAVGFLMSTKGLVELIILNIGLSKGVISKDIFAIMVVMAVTTTFAATPMTMWLYKPARDVPRYKRRKVEIRILDNEKLALRMLLCVHGMQNLLGMMNLIEMSKGRSPKHLQVKALRLVEFSERSSAIRMTAVARALDSRNNETVDIEDNPPVNEDAVGIAMRAFAQVNDVKIRVSHTISLVSSMHEHICSAAANSRANIIILPFHKYPRPDGSLESAETGFLHVNERVMKESPCSAAIFVDRGLGSLTVWPLAQPGRSILCLFFGGPDDREALLVAIRMLERGGVKLTVVQCILTVRQQPATLSRVCTEDLMKYLPQESGAKFSYREAKNCLRRWKDRSCRRYNIPWRNHHCHDEAFDDRATLPVQVKDATHSSRLPSNPSTPAVMDGMAEQMTKQANEGEPHHRSVSSSDCDAIPVPVTHLEQEDEKKLDLKLLGPLLASAKLSKDAPGGLESRGVTVKVVEMDDPGQGIEELLTAGEDYGLIIVGFHVGRPESAVQRAGNFPSGIFDQGLGPVGNLLLSKEKRAIKSSLLVVRQHRPGINESRGGMFDLEAIDDDEDDHQVASVGEEPTKQILTAKSISQTDIPA